MNNDERQQIDRLTSRAVDRGKRNFADQSKAIYASHAAKGLLRSGATIKAAVRQMETTTREVMTGLLDDVSIVSRTEEAFSEIDTTIGAILAAMAEELPKVIRMSGQEIGSAAASAALGLYRTMKTDIEADLLIARQGFLAGPSDRSEEANQPAPNKGGKPLARHWDAMWAEIAALCWNGEFDPKSQADIKRTMFELLTAKGIDAGDTAVTERARQLWRAIDAKR